MAIVTSGNLRYTSTLQLAKAIFSAEDGIDWEPGQSRTLETVGTGDNSNDTFYLDQKNIISGTLSLAYGATESSITALTETTDYTIDLETGIITLTAGGVIAIGS